MFFTIFCVRIRAKNRPQKPLPFCKLFIDIPRGVWYDYREAQKGCVKHRMLCKKDLEEQSNERNSKVVQQ